MIDYLDFRGKCKEMADALAKTNNLTVVRGHYYCPIWNSDEPHWWCKDIDGNIIDPSAKQFPSNGLGIYTEFDGVVECAQCGKQMQEDDAKFYGNYAFCSTPCICRFVGI